MPISAMDCINPAFEHAKQQLLRPFRFGQWVRLALVGLLAGELGSVGCNTGFNLPSSHQGKGTGQVLSSTSASHFAQQVGQLLGQRLPNHPSVSPGLITFLIVAGLCLVLLLMYIASVMRFVLFDSIVARECHIRAGWARNTGHCFQLFVWQILLMLITFAAIFVLFAIPVASAGAFGWFAHPKEHLLPLVLGGIALFFLLVLFVTVLMVIHVMTKDFVVPQMVLENISAAEGWRRLWARLEGEKVGYAGYIGMKIVLAIAAGVIFGIMILIVLVVLLLPIVGAGWFMVLGGKAAGLVWNFSTIALAVVAGCIVFALVMFVISFISVPGTVFFPAYAIYFFAARYPPLAALLWPQASATAPPPVEPSPLSSAPMPFN